MWLVIKDLYSGVRAQVLHSGSLSRTFDNSQGTGQDRILVRSYTKFTSMVC